MTDGLTAPIVQAVNLRKRYDDDVVIDDISIDFARHKAHTIVGPSGIGKTTFLRCLSALTKPDSGKVIIDGVDITQTKVDRIDLRRKLGIVFQTFNLFPHWTCLDNITMAPKKVLKQTDEEAAERGMSLLRMFELEDKWDDYPGELSAGERQRIAIARTLAMDPEIIVFDEVTSALDPKMMFSIASMIRGLIENQRTCLIASHDMAFVRAVSDFVYYLDEGRLVEKAETEDFFERPTNPRTVAFLGGANEAA